MFVPSYTIFEYAGMRTQSYKTALIELNRERLVPARFGELLSSRQWRMPRHENEKTSQAKGELGHRKWYASELSRRELNLRLAKSPVFRGVLTCRGNGNPPLSSNHSEWGN
jgi:hypothetical protein